ncbi:dihydrofolate reductase family protein [Actinocrispum wychmicini]|uniref:Dihydrofolate reductase n=1 Tax=Actinocrispum wychmicini TaxID=1213861 RepID=A0A4R2IQ05_9PSEU|nr:dihydrofolate reductase family protein [Actinocrispum wychmicini]TCO47283.1 dihydrofolate reductase [Actinocrispum wychmicini]
MRKLTVMVWTTLDGVAQAPGGPDEDSGSGFVHGGWAAPYVDRRILDVATAMVTRASAMLMGRTSYEIFAGAWPGADDPIGARLNALPKYVASTTLDSVAWENSTLLTGDVAEAVRELKQGDGGEIQVHGSLGLVQTLLTHDLVDEFLIMVAPVVLGTGKRLFGDGAFPAGLRLVGTMTSGNGVVVSTYARDGKVQYGEVGPKTENW